MQKEPGKKAVRIESKKANRAALNPYSFSVGRLSRISARLSKNNLPFYFCSPWFGVDLGKPKNCPQYK